MVEIASVSIPISAELKGFYRDIEKLDKDLKQRTNQINAFTLKPNVDISALKNFCKELGKELDCYKDTQRYLDSNPLTVKTNTRPIDETIGKLKQVQALAQEVRSINLGASGSSGTSSGTGNSKIKVEVDSKALEENFKTVAKGLEKSIADATTRGIQKADIKPKTGGLLGGIFRGFSEDIGRSINVEVQRSLKRNFGFDLKKTVSASMDAAAAPVKIFVTENQELQSTFKKVGDSLGDRMRQAGYRVGDGIVAALEQQGGTITEKINAFTKAAINPTEIKQAFEELKNEAKSTAKEVGQAFVGSPNLKPYISRVGERISNYREVSLRERAVPLVQQRAAEILQQKRAKNSANLVNDETEQFIISTGGYAGARGLSGQRIAAELGKQFGENVVSVWVRNLDTDLPKESMGKASSKLQALLTSLAKPNIRGYSQDAVEIASQALAALERNPDLKVKILGESGGGYPAEEAAKLLNMMGAGDRVEYLGVGTPDFTGRLKGAPGQKIISPDERLGAEVHGVYGRFGFAETGTSAQNVLGVEGHPYEHYRDAGVAELQNFLQGPPEPLSKDQLGEIKKAAQAFELTDTRQLDTRQLQEFSRQAFANLQTIRRQLLVATDETRDELEAIAKAFQKVYVRTAAEPREFEQIRQVIAQAEGLYRQISENRGVGAGMTASQAVKELRQYQQEFNQKYSKAVGTIGLKTQDISESLKNLITAFDDPSLSVKPKTPVVQPEVTFKEPNGGELAEAEAPKKGMIQRVVDRGVQAVVNKVQSDIETTREAVIDLVINRINDQLMRVPGQPDVLDPSRQIGGLDELELGDFLKLARVGTEDTLRAGVGGTAKAMAVAKGAESMLFGAAPPLALIKAITQRVGFPIAAFTAAGALPGVGGAEAGLTQLTSHMLQMPAEQLATAMSGAFADAVGATISGLPLIGGKLGPALTEAIAGMLHQAAGTLAGGAAEVLTPIAGGQIMLGAGQQAAKAVLPALPEAQIAANRQLQAATEQQLKVLQRGIETVKALLPVNPSKAGLYVEGIKREYPQIAGQLDQAIAALPPSQRMAAGSELAALKGQLVKAQQDLAKAEDKASKLTQFVQGIADMVNRPMEQIQKQVKGVDDIIEAEVISSERVNVRALPDARMNLQQKFDAIVSATATQIKDLGEEFSRQSATLKRGNLDPKVKAEVAASIEKTINEARRAVEQSIQAFGSNVPAEVRKAASSTRQRITKAEQSAQGTIVSAKQAGINIPEGLNQGIESRITSLKATGEALADAVIIATENKLEIRSPSRVFMRIGQNVAKGFEVGLKGFQYATNAIDQFIASFEEQIGVTKGTVSGLIGIVKNAAVGFLAFNVLGSIIPFLTDTTKSALDAAMSMEQFGRMLEFGAGSASKARVEMASLKEEANRLGLDLKTSIQGQAQLAAATRGTALEGKATEQIGQATRQATAVYGLNPEQADRVQVAIQQMASKGKLSSEELRQQLGETLPGAFQIAARSIGVTTAELDKMLQRGDVLSEDFLPKFAQQLSAETSVGVAGAANSAQAAVNRFNTAVFTTQAAFGEQLQPVQKLGLNTMAAALNAVNQNSEIAVKTLGMLALIFGTSLVGGVIGVVRQLGLLPPLLNLIKAGATGAGAAIKSMAGGFVLAYAAIEGAQLLIDAFSDHTGGLKDIADDASNSVERLTSSLDNLSKLDKPDQGGQTLLGRSGGIMGWLEKNVPGVMNSPYNQDMKQFLVGQQQGKFDEQFQRIGQSSQAVIQSTSSLIARESGSVDEFVRKGLNALSGRNSDAIEQLKKYDRQLADLNSKERIIRVQRPDDTAGLKAIQDQKDTILKAREEVSGDVIVSQKELQSNVDRIKKAIEALDSLYEQRAISGDKYKEETIRLTNELARAQAAQDGFNKALDVSAESITRLTQNFEKMVAQFADAKEAIEQSTNASRQELSRQQTAGFLTPGQVQGRSDSINQQNLIAQIQANQNTIAQLRTQISTTEIGVSLTDLGLTSDKTVGTNELDRMAEQFKDSPRESLAIKTLKELKTREMDVSNLQTQLDESVAQASQQLRDAAKQIRDFYRSVSRSAEEIRRSIESTKLDTEIQKVKNEFQSKLNGFSGRFFGDFLNGITDLIDLLYQPIQNLQQANQQIAGLNNQYQDVQLQGQELQRGLYVPGAVSGKDGGAGGVVGGAIASGLYTGPSANIGGSTEYHIDNKFSMNLPIDQVMQMFDQMAAGYRAQGRKIEFSNPAVAGEIYDETADPKVKQELLRRAMAAHNHSTHSGLNSLDYYVPLREGNRYDSSVEGVQMLIPSVPGAQLDYLRSAGYGNNVAIMQNGQPIFMAGHGDDRRALPQNRTIEATAQAPRPQQSSNPASALVGAAGSAGAVDWFSGGSNSLVARLIGLSEGTRTPDGGFTQAYYGHVDPGNGKWNQGSFSYQGAASSPQEADRIWQSKLESVFSVFSQAAKKAGLDPNNPLLGASFLDLYDQAPDAAVGEGGFLDQLPALARRGVSLDTILDARVQSYYLPNGQLAAGGFDNDLGRLTADQRRRLEAINSGVQQLGVTGGGGAIAQANGIQVPGLQAVDTSPIGQATSNLYQSVQGQTSALLAQVQAKNEYAAIQLRQTLDKRKRELQDNSDDLAQTVKEGDRRVQDAVLDSFGSDPVRQILDQYNQYAREADDKTRETQRLIRDTQSEIENLTAARDLFVEHQNDPLFAGVKELIPGMNQAIEQSQANLDKIKEQVKQEDRIRDERQAAARRQYEQQREDALIPIQRQRRDLRFNLGIAGIQNPQLQQFAQNQANVNRINDQYSDQFRELNRQIADVTRGIDRLKTEGFALDSEPVQLATERLNDLLSKVKALQENQTIELQINASDQTRAIDQYMFGRRSELASAQANLLNAQGDRFGANRVQRQMGYETENRRFNEEMIGISSLEGTGQFSPETIAQMREDAVSLNDVNLDNIKAQFTNFGQEVNKSTQAAFGNFLSAIPNVLTGAQSLGDAFKGMADSILNSLGQLLSELAMQGIRDLFFGGDKEKPAKATGGLGGIVSSGISILGSIFGGGGAAAAAAAPVAQTGFGDIASLLKFADGGPVPGIGIGDTEHALLTPGEFVLNRHAVKAIGLPSLHRWNSIKRYADGGMVGSLPERGFRDYAGESASRKKDEAIDVKYTKIGEQNYVSQDDIPGIIQEAARRGAQGGLKMVETSMRNSPGWRSRHGV